jgi:hypothetical protein
MVSIRKYYGSLSTLTRLADGLGLKDYPFISEFAPKTGSPVSIQNSAINIYLISLQYYTIRPSLL